MLNGLTVNYTSTDKTIVASMMLTAKKSLLWVKIQMAT